MVEPAARIGYALGATGDGPRPGWIRDLRHSRARTGRALGRDGPGGVLDPDARG